MAESAPRIFYCDGSPDLDQFWRVKGPTCVFYRSSVTSPLVSPSDSSLTLCQADLYKKQHLEFQRAEAAIRSIMSQPEHAQRLLDEHDPASVARSAAMGE